MSPHVGHILTVIAFLLEHTEVIGTVIACFHLFCLFCSTFLPFLLAAGKVWIKLAFLQVQSLCLPSTPAVASRHLATAHTRQHRSHGTTSHAWFLSRGPLS